MCKQLKENIDSAKYDALVSDDTGGRLPTLILREVIKKVNPEKDLKTLFVATGMTYRPQNEEDQNLLENYLKKGLGDSKKVLLVTQYIHTGKTLGALARNLKKIGVPEIDATSIYGNVEEHELIRDIDHLVLGGYREKGQGEFSEDNNVLSGIYKHTDNYSPSPARLDNLLISGESDRTDFLSDEEFSEIAGYEQYDNFEERAKKVRGGTQKFPEIDSVPISEEEEKQIQENINKARKKVKELADAIVKEVWGTNQ
jgi:hypothetical protein